MARTVDRIRISGPQVAEDVDLAGQARLAEDIQPVERPAVPLGEAREILLTGASGFLGTYLLRELLDQTRANIHCLVRAESAEHAAARIRGSLEGYGLWDDAYLARIRPLAGALDRERLGLDEAAARLIDAIVHNAATVGTSHSYGMLRADNVVGTENVLRFACEARNKPVHHVSTLSVFPGNRWVGGVIEEDPRVDPTGLSGGYPMTKWVAEQLVLEAGARGLPVAIYRPGRIVKDSGAGPLPPTDLAGLSNLSWLLELGSVPAAEDTPAVDLVPVDYVAAAIVQIARNPASEGRVFHLNNPHLASFADVVAAFRSAGHRLEEVSAKAWAVEVYRRQEALPYIPGAWREVLDQWAQELEEGETEIVDLPAPGPGRSRVDCRQTMRFLEGTGIVCPPTADVLSVLVAHLRAL
jgi:myxalamid-type nonribosomal peptide synthetase MxaA